MQSSRKFIFPNCWSHAMVNRRLIALFEFQESILTGIGLSTSGMIGKLPLLGLYITNDPLTKLDGRKVDKVQLMTQSLYKAGIELPH